MFQADAQVSLLHLEMSEKVNMQHVCVVYVSKNHSNKLICELTSRVKEQFQRLNNWTYLSLPGSQSGLLSP